MDGLDIVFKVVEFLDFMTEILVSQAQIRIQYNFVRFFVDGACYDHQILVYNDLWLFYLLPLHVSLSKIPFEKVDSIWVFIWCCVCKIELEIKNMKQPSID